MKKRIFSIIAAALLMIIAAAPVLADNAPSAVERSAASVVRLTVNTSFGEENVSGIVIGKGSGARYILTGLRVIEGRTGDILAGFDEGENITASVAATDEKTGIAVLELNGDIDGIKPAKLRMKELETGDKVYTVGYYAKKDSANIKEGTVLSHNSYSSGALAAQIYQVTAAVTARNNGGMLTDKRGTLAGICYYDGNTEANKVVTSAEIARVLDSLGMKYKKATVLYLIIAIILIAAALAAAVCGIYAYMKKKRENQPRLTGMSGELLNQSVPVTAENISIGRDAKICQIVIMHDAKVSRCHCSIRYDAMKHSFVLTDLSSTHGTFVNGQRLEPNVPRYIGTGTVFKLGSDGTAFMVCEGGGSK